MQFHFTYRGQSSIRQGSSGTSLSFAPDLSRPPTFFDGELADPVAFREAIGALHDVVISDLRQKPKDRTAYLEWAARQEQIDWEQVAARRQTTAIRIKAIRDELHTLQQQRHRRWGEYYRAQQRYFQYLYEKERDLWFVLDPVVTVHPDELFFECFSQDESTYGRLGVGYDRFRQVRSHACGTTNIDYSAALYEEFQKLRSYRRTRLSVDPGGFEVRTSGEEDYREVKIDLPNSWVRGFLQVSSAMSLPAVHFELAPMDIHNLCFVLRRHREKLGPRSLRYRLVPGEPVRIVFDPWGYEVVCPRSIYEGPTAQEIRVWGRRRLLILERLIPLARRFQVHLLGTGMPSFYLADLGEMHFTLGLSGWTRNDWASAGNFDLLAPRVAVDTWTQERVFTALRQNWRESTDALAARLHLDRAVVLGALAAWTQAGRAIYDLSRGLWRARELSRDPLPIEALRFANPREEAASRFLAGGAVSATATAAGHGIRLAGTVRDREHSHTTSVTIDGDERVISAECTCNWHQHNKLFKGPCEHILALRLSHARRERTLASLAGI